MSFLRARASIARYSAY